MDVVKKFDRYCYELQILTKDEEPYSAKLSMMRRKLRKYLAEIAKLEGDYSDKFELFWKVAYYMPINMYLRGDDEIDSSTLLTIFCGEMTDFLAVSNQYSSRIHLYLGDLHRYMAKDQVQYQIAKIYYEKALELDSGMGRAYHMLGMMEECHISKIRLFLRSLTSMTPFNSEKSLNDSLENLQLENNEEFSSFVVRFVHWAVFEQ
ncbi:unnamed protein product [Caenorhabditis bovis]|nr:unnamed protein product [Caenorhabditis bovis]